MRATIEINEIKIDSSNMYVRDYYPSEGFYLVENDSLQTLVIVIGWSVVYVTNNIPKFISKVEDQPKPEDKFSEEFILKLVAIAANKENYKNLNAQPLK